MIAKTFDRGWELHTFDLSFKPQLHGPAVCIDVDGDNVDVTPDRPDECMGFYSIPRKALHALLEAHDAYEAAKEPPR